MRARIGIVVMGLGTGLLAGCSALLSTVDKVHPVHLHGERIASARKPDRFVVAPGEVMELAPATKYAWNLYADEEAYYLSPELQKLGSASGDNSWLARRRGIRIRGTTRDDLEALHERRRRTGRPLTPPEMRLALDQ